MAWGGAIFNRGRHRVVDFREIDVSISNLFGKIEDLDIPSRGRRRRAPAAREGAYLSQTDSQFLFAFANYTPIKYIREDWSLFGEKMLPLYIYLNGSEMLITEFSCGE